MDPPFITYKRSFFLLFNRRQLNQSQSWIAIPHRLRVRIIVVIGDSHSKLEHEKILQIFNSVFKLKYFATKQTTTNTIQHNITQWIHILTRPHHTTQHSIAQHIHHLILFNLIIQLCFIKFFIMRTERLFFFISQYRNQQIVTLTSELSRPFVVITNECQFGESLQILFFKDVFHNKVCELIKQLPLEFMIFVHSYPVSSSRFLFFMYACLYSFYSLKCRGIYLQMN
jgi:hypothetical protein